MAASGATTTRQQTWAEKDRQGVSFDIPSDLHEAVRGVADEQERPMAWVFRRALAEYVERYRAEQPPPAPRRRR